MYASFSFSLLLRMPVDLGRSRSVSAYLPLVYLNYVQDEPVTLISVSKYARQYLPSIDFSLDSVFTK